MTAETTQPSDTGPSGADLRADIAALERELVSIETLHDILDMRSPMVTEHRRALERHRDIILAELRDRGEPCPHRWEKRGWHIDDEGMMQDEFVCSRCGDTRELAFMVCPWVRRRLNRRRCDERN